MERQGEPPTDDDTQQQKCEKPIIHYSNGKLSFECATDGATCQSTITDTDIASYSENEIQLSATYNISVYASKEGFDNSDVATATLCWIDADPKTEGIESGVAQVRANAVLIQSHDGIQRKLFHHHLNPKYSSPRRTLREEDVSFPDVITHAPYGGTCGYSPAFLSFATCSNTMCCLAFAFYFCSLSRKCYEATRIDVSCRLG